MVRSCRKSAAVVKTGNIKIPRVGPVEVAEEKIKARRVGWRAIERYPFYTQFTA